MAGVDVDTAFRTTYRRVEDLEECEGKVVEAVATWGYGPEKIGIRFADGSYLCCGAAQGYEVASFDLDVTMDEDDAQELCIIDGDEHARVKAAKKAASEAWQKARQKEIDRQAIARALDLMLERGQINLPDYKRMKAEHEQAV